MLTMPEVASLRHLSYPDAHVILLCFSVVHPETFRALRSRWLAELSGRLLLNDAATHTAATDGFTYAGNRLAESVSHRIIDGMMNTGSPAFGTPYHSSTGKLSARDNGTRALLPVTGISTRQYRRQIKLNRSNQTSKNKQSRGACITHKNYHIDKHDPSTSSSEPTSFFASLHRPDGPPGPAFLLIGCACDLRHDIGCLLELSVRGEVPVDERIAERLALQLGAEAYIECSALTQKNLKRVFDLAIWCSLKVHDAGGPGRPPSPTQSFHMAQLPTPIFGPKSKPAACHKSTHAFSPPPKLFCSGIWQMGRQSRRRSNKQNCNTQSLTDFDNKQLSSGANSNVLFTHSRPNASSTQCLDNATSERFIQSPHLCDHPQSIGSREINHERSGQKSVWRRFLCVS
ncbi:unnamed protein product [Protopolystoma xenopodis]|uniref:Uncharacterized protein n=1 Tax=Protopolystoma xenopodis TaxID=117903 RepID=A0A3S5A3A5_9PLAT|nr:unnamed protein product [Protopolystoma xenopodis]